MNTIFEEISRSIKELSKRVAKFETWEPAQAVAHHGAHAYLTSNVNSSIGAWYTVPFDAELWDTSSIHAAGVFTAPVDGRYLCTTHIRFTTYAGTWNLRFLPNASSVDAMLRVIDANYNGALLTGTYNLSAGDTIQTQVYRTGSALALTGSAYYPYYCFTQMELIS